MTSPQGRSLTPRERRRETTLHKRHSEGRTASGGIIENVSRERSSVRQPRPRLCAAVGLTTALMGLVGFPRAEAFLLSATPRMGGARTRSLRSSLGRLEGVSRRRACRIVMVAEEGANEAVDPQSVLASETTTKIKEINQPPDRDAALRMIKDRVGEEQESEELGPYAQADIPDLPKPPYYFMTPGEFGNDTLCTNPNWHTALLAIKWLGVPLEVRHKDDDDAEEEGAILIMGDEVYDDPREVVSGLPERALLSDFVESLPHVTAAINKLEPAWRALHYNNDAEVVEKLEKTLESTLRKIENILVRKVYSGELLEGDELTVGDFTLGVTTFHMLAAFAPGKQWKFPDKLVNLKAHMKEMHNMQIFEMVVPSAEILAKKYAEPL